MAHAPDPFGVMDEKRIVPRDRWCLPYVDIGQEFDAFPHETVFLLWKAIASGQRKDPAIVGKRKHVAGPPRVAHAQILAWRCGGLEQDALEQLGRAALLEEADSFVQVGVGGRDALGALVVEPGSLQRLATPLNDCVVDGGDRCLLFRGLCHNPILPERVPGTAAYPD